ncbi:hypothetical protein NGRA_1548 [Nosema granulosis]|uniref:Uncharacterized protein n=1 Tax=Nosema granulosis TaxID=83296 RepID=A0A9P6H103_9MICR|nr:hypothetical protein NGRA_1548 [Nosema granulosis]
MRIVFKLCFFMCRVLSVPAHKIYMSAVYEETLSRDRKVFLYKNDNLKLADIKLPKSLVDYKVDADDFTIDKELDQIQAMFKYETLNEFKSSTKYSSTGLYTMEQEFDLDYNTAIAKYLILFEFEFLEGNDKKFKLKKRVKRAELLVEEVQVLYENNEITCNIANERSQRFMNLFKFMFVEKYELVSECISEYLTFSYIRNYPEKKMIEYLDKKLLCIELENGGPVDSRKEEENVKLVYSVFINARKWYKRKINSAFNEMLYLRNTRETPVIMYHCVCIDVEFATTNHRGTKIVDLKDLEIHCFDLAGVERNFNYECFFVFGNKICLKIIPLCRSKTCFVSIISEDEVILKVPVKQFLDEYLASANK